MCNQVFGIKPPLDDPTETHGLCGPCFAQEMVKLEEELKKIRQKGDEKDGVQDAE